MSVMGKADAAKMGRQAGSKQIPGWDDADHAPYIRGVAAHAQNAINRLEARFDANAGDARLRRSFVRSRELRDTWQKRLDEAERERDAALDQYEHTHGARPAVVRPPSQGWWIFVVLFILGELALNVAALQLLRIPQWQVFALALTVGGVIAVGAHFVGTYLHRDEWSVGRRIAYCGILTAVVLVAMYGMAWLREYLMVKNAMGGQPGGTSAEDGMASSLATISFWTFFAINLIFYIVAVFLSHSAHEPIRVAVGSVGKADRYLKHWARAVEDAKTRRIKHAQRYHGLSLCHRDRCYELVDTFNHANLMARDVASERSSSADPKRGQPLSFGTYPHIYIPPHWADPTKLDWS